MILGGAGFVGSHLAARHLRAGHEVTCAVRSSWKRPSSDFLAGALFRPTDLGDVEQVEDLFASARPTLVYHLATSTPQKIGGSQDPFDPAWMDDLRNFTTVLGVARRYRPELEAFIRTGSLAEYGRTSTPSREDDHEEPETLHGTALLAATHYFRLAARNLPFRTATARLALTYGPDQKPGFLVSDLIRHCLARQPFHVREPSSRRDMIHVDDVARGLMALANSSVSAGSIVNLCSGVAVSNRRLAEMVVSVTKADPALLTFGPEDPDPSVLWCSTTKARELLGFEARIALADGIERVVQSLTERST
nr:NAD(P)-dependent oxidoreductase [Sphingomonas arenae]